MNNSNESKEESIDETERNNKCYNLCDENKENKDGGLSDELREELENMPEPIYSREEKLEYTPFPIRDGNDLRRSKNQYRCYSWILKKLPIEEYKLIALMNFAFNKEKKESYPLVKQLLVLNLLRKIENDVLIPTVEFIHYIQDLNSEIGRYEKEGKEE